MGLKLKGAVGHADPSFFVQKIPRRMVSTTKNPINPVFRDPCATSLVSTHPQLCAPSFLRHLTVDLRASFPPKSNIRNIDPRSLEF